MVMLVNGHSQGFPRGKSDRLSESRGAEDAAIMNYIQCAPWTGSWNTREKLQITLCHWLISYDAWTTVRYTTVTMGETVQGRRGLGCHTGAPCIIFATFLVSLQLL